MEEFRSRIRSSDDYKREESMLNPLNGLPMFTTSDFTLLRKFLAFEPDLISCQRSGALANCTKEKAKVRDGKRINKVANQKTRKSHGPANFCTGKDLHDKLVLFVNHVRPLDSPRNNFKFFTITGMQIETWQISTQLHLFVTRCSGHGNAEPPRRVCANFIRKFASTLTIQERECYSACVASLLSHSQGAADKYYRFYNKREQALKVTKVLKDIFGSQQLSVWPEKIVDILKETFDVEISKQKISKYLWMWFVINGVGYLVWTT